MDPRSPRDRYLTRLDTQPHLSVPERRELVQALGPLEYEGPALLTNASLRARVELESSCVREVLPRWVARWPDDSGPADLLAWTQTYLDGKMARHQHKVLSGRVLTSGGDREPAGWPARVAVAVAAVARVARTGDVIADYADDERMMDLEDWDAGVLCGAIQADGPPWEEPDAMQQWWRWYLTEAYERALLVAKMA
jgi:hypothetical protein